MARLTNRDVAELLSSAAADEEVDQRRRAPHRVIEMNLSPDGRSDMDPGALAQLDLVLGAFHSRLRVTDDQTDRYVAALRNRPVHVLAHPRGRIYDFRAGLRARCPRAGMTAASQGGRADKYPYGGHFWGRRPGGCPRPALVDIDLREELFMRRRWIQRV